MSFTLIDKTYQCMNGWIDTLETKELMALAFDFDYSFRENYLVILRLCNQN